MPVTITRAQRDALYEEVLTDLTAIGDIYEALDQGDAEEARQLWERFGGELRLLDEIGWSAVEPREQFEITMPRDALVHVLGHLQTRAAQAVGAHLAEPKEGVQRGLYVLAACAGALGQLAGQPGAEWS